jgi:D-3-phosphoglycerate dehydrogenase
LNLGRRAKAGEAMVVLSLDTPAAAETIEKLAASVEARFIRAVHMH